MSYSFSYTARNQAGAFVAGSLDARSRTEAIELLRMRSLVLTSIVSSKSASGTIVATVTASFLGFTARTVAFRSLATLVRAGLPLRRGLEIVARQTAQGALREALESVAVDIENGTSFSASLARHPRVFSRTVCTMIRAGEVSGTLDGILQRVADLLERSGTVRKRTLSALSYPIVVVTMALALVGFLVATIVPAMKELFRGFDRPLPLMTRALIFAGDTLHTPLAWVAVLALGGGAVIAFRFALRDPRYAALIEPFKQRIPLFGKLLRQSEISVSSRTLGTLLESGVPLDSALDITADAVSSHGMRRSLARIAQHARLGQSLAPAFTGSGFYEPHIVGLIRAAEEAGTLGEMLLRIAEYADVEIETALTTISTLLEPLFIVVVGAIVGLIVAAILVPLYSGIGNLA